MRAWIGAGTLGALLAVALPLAADATRPSSTTPLAPSASEPAPVGPLAADDRYVRHGAITTMSTCLAVADDPQAVGLWQSWVPDGFVRPDGEVGLAGWLIEQDGHMRPGFGTLLACAQVVRTWQHVLAGASAAPSLALGQPGDGDGRLEHGTLVIDLDRDGRQSPIAARPLIRLLTSAGLLPRAVYGGVAIRSAVIEDPLLFNNLHLNMPIAFVDTTFRAGDYPKDLYGKEEITNRSITIANSRFDDHVLIADSTICGEVGVVDSRFAETFELHRVRHDGTGCPRRDGQAPSPSLRIDSSSFEQSLRISRSTFRAVSMASNTIQSVILADDDFGAALTLLDNDIGSLMLDRVELGTRTSINYNRIANDFFIWDSERDESARPKILAQLQIMSNRIGGGLGLGGSALDALPGLHEDEHVADFELNLMSNHVGNGSVICLPAAWPGRVTLAGSSYSGTLTLGARSAGEELDESCNDAARAVPVAHIEERKGGAYCPPVVDAAPDILVVELMATEIRTLRWHLPLDCRHRWRGFGLSYELWLPDQDPRLKSPDWEEMAFRAWRTTLAGYEPAPLHAMSQYLAGNGAYVPSRMIQTEAKRLNYADSCPPHRWFWACLFGLGTDGGDASDVIGSAQAAPSSSGHAGNGPRSTEPAVRTESWSAYLSQLWFWIDEQYWTPTIQTITLIFLFPAGYGAVPERALLCLAAGMLGFGLLYRGYIKRAERRFEQARRLLPEVLGRLEQHVSARAQAGQRDAEARRMQKMREAYAMLPEVGDDDYRDGLRAIVQDVVGLARSSRFRDPDLETINRYVKYAGTTDIPGFSRFNQDKRPTRFTHWRYSIDTMLPVIDLHAYSSYYPEWRVMRGISVVQHIFGWWWITVFIASAAIL